MTLTAAEQAKQKVELRKTLNRAYYLKHAERLRAAQRARHAANPEYGRRYASEWRSRPENQQRVRESNRRSHFKNSYGLTIEQVDQMAEQQDNRCLICGGLFGDAKSLRKSVDHCHKTNAIRGILHGKCNAAIGILGDTAEGVKRALDYLERARTGPTKSRTAEAGSNR